MFDISNGLPEMIGLELARRVRARRLLRNLCVDDFAAQIGVSGKTLGTFERTGRGHGSKLGVRLWHRRRDHGDAGHLE